MKSKLLLTTILVFTLSSYIPPSAAATTNDAPSIDKSDSSIKSVLAFAYEAILLSAYNYNFVSYKSQSHIPV